MITTPKQTANVHDLLMPQKKLDVITPHRLSVAIFIRVFQNARDTDMVYRGLPTQCKRKFDRKFSIFLLKSIQSPDMTLEELISLYSHHLMYMPFCENITIKFENVICSINEIGIRHLQDVVDSIGSLVAINQDTLDKGQVISRISVVGYYLRRLVTHFDKLTFSEVTAFLEIFKKYSRNFISTTVPNSSNSSNSSLEEEWVGQWTKRQAELFMATQAALLMNNEQKALRPKELKGHITQMLKANNHLSEAHFLSYLNFLRVKEFCGAVDSLHQCYDKNVGCEGRGTVDEKTKGYRYAALNIAILQFQFGNRDEAKIALDEAIKMAQEAGDNVCLQHAMAWMYCMIPENRHKFIEHSILKCLELNLSYIMSLGIQAFVQQAGLTCGNPKHIFETITKSDILNSQHLHSDLISISFAQKAALWQFYGKPEIASLMSQLLLYENTSDTSFSALSKTHYGEGYCQGLCHMANQLLLDGDYSIVNSILSFAREQFPNEPISHNWMLCENIFHFTIHLYHQEYEEALLSAQKISIVDEDESLLRLTELHIQKQDFKEAQECLNKVMDNVDKRDILRMDNKVRAMILMADMQIASCGSRQVIPELVTLLNSAIRIAHDHHFDYLLAMVHLRIAHTQILMGQHAQALFTFDRCLVQILAHGGCYDRAFAQFLHVICIVSNSKHKNDKERGEIILEAAQMLNKVRDLFLRVEAYHAAKDVLYLQSILYHSIGKHKERNDCALHFRLLDEEYPSKFKTNLLRLIGRKTVACM